MGVPGEIQVQVSALQEIFVNLRTAGSLPPHPGLLAKRQPNLKRRDNVLGDTILKIKYIVQAAIKAVGP